MWGRWLLEHAFEEVWAWHHPSKCWGNVCGTELNNLEMLIIRSPAAERASFLRGTCRQIISGLMFLLSNEASPCSLSQEQKGGSVQSSTRSLQRAAYAALLLRWCVGSFYHCPRTVSRTSWAWESKQSRSSSSRGSLGRMEEGSRRTG